jgi:hypothetical protein
VIPRAARLRCVLATVHSFGCQVNRGKVGSCRQGSTSLPLVTLVFRLRGHMMMPQPG